MRRDWPLLLIAAGLLLGAAVQTSAGGNVDFLVGSLLTLGSVCLGAWIKSDGALPTKDPDDG